MRIVNKLRDFGVSIEDIQMANAQVMSIEPYDSYPIFEYYLIHAWFSKIDAYFVMWSGGFADTFDSTELERIKLVNKQSSHVLLISFKEILKEMGVKSVKEPATLFPLSKEEITLIDEIRHGKDREITVKINDERKIEKLKSKRRLNDGNIRSKDLIGQLQNERLYGSIVFDFKGGKVSATFYWSPSWL